MKNTVRIRNGLFLLFVISAGLLVYKAYLGYEKLTAAKKAEHFYTSQQYVKSETFYKNAINNRSILYKENEIQSTYTMLSNNNKEVSALLEKADSLYRNENYSGLIKTYKSYLDLLEKKQNDPVFLDYDQHFNVQNEFDTLLSNTKKNLYKQMDANVNNEMFENEYFIAILGELPNEVYGSADKKTEELTSHFINYDERKYSLLEKSLRYNQLKKTINHQISSYHKIGLEAFWLKETPKKIEKAHELKMAALEEERKRKEEELKKAMEAEKAKDPAFQEEIMTVVNEYAIGWMSAYNQLDTSYFVHITPELLNFFDERFEEIRSNQTIFTGELLYTEFDLDSFNYSMDDEEESVELNVVLTMNSASYAEGEIYEMKETANPWYYKLIHTNDGWKLSERKELVHFNYSNTRIYEFAY
ncbi:hypothetical protein LIS82_05135 [Cytobacillus solani]|uniref:hypothetical protein n=1 Tax=Cytobacillus solani TaxID=1637975 RepID=UPI00207AD39F|nr:hypothetical protein [Cytobacillus solani]USK55916.1 hypothetical protein LIS82_05135 [Cytobacillus solani]